MHVKCTKILIPSPLPSQLTACNKKLGAGDGGGTAWEWGHLCVLVDLFICTTHRLGFWQARVQNMYHIITKIKAILIQKAHMHMHMYMHAYTHILTNTHTHGTNTHTHTHTHTYKHTPFLAPWVDHRVRRSIYGWGLWSHLHSWDMYRYTAE